MSMTDMPQGRHVLVPSSHSRASFLFASNIHLAQHPSRTPCHGVKKKDHEDRIAGKGFN